MIRLPSLRCVVPCILFVASAALSGGCSNAVDQFYEASTLGGPLPAPLPAEAIVRGCGASLRQPPKSVFLGIDESRVAKILVDDSGIVAARSLRTKKTNHWQGLLFNTTETYVLEVEVPETSFRESATDWGEKVGNLAFLAKAYEFSGSVLSIGDSTKGSMPEWMLFPPPGAALSDLLAGCLDGRYGFGSFLVAQKATEDRKARERAEKGASAGGNTESEEAIVTATPDSLTPTNVPQYIALVDQLLLLLPQNSKTTTTGRVLDIPATLRWTPPTERGTVPSLYALEEVFPEAFEGLTKAGFHWHGERKGIVLDTRNMGERRVRVEVLCSAAARFKNSMNELRAATASDTKP